MRMFWKMIVENNHGHWSAWFENSPQIVSAGELPSAAIQSLIDQYGDDHFDTDQMIAVDDAVRSGHLEFFVLLPHHRWIPSPSIN